MSYSFSSYWSLEQSQKADFKLPTSYDSNPEDYLLQRDEIMFTGFPVNCSYADIEEWFRNLINKFENFKDRVSIDDIIMYKENGKLIVHAKVLKSFEKYYPTVAEKGVCGRVLFGDFGPENEEFAKYLWSGFQQHVWSLKGNFTYGHEHKIIKISPSLYSGNTTLFQIMQKLFMSQSTNDKQNNDRSLPSFNPVLVDLAAPISLDSGLLRSLPAYKFPSSLPKSPNGKFKRRCSEPFVGGNQCDAQEKKKQKLSTIQEEGHPGPTGSLIHRNSTPDLRVDLDEAEELATSLMDLDIELKQPKPSTSVPKKKFLWKGNPK